MINIEELTSRLRCERGSGHKGNDNNCPCFNGPKQRSCYFCCLFVKGLNFWPMPMSIRKVLQGCQALRQQISHRACGKQLPQNTIGSREPQPFTSGASVQLQSCSNLKFESHSAAGPWLWRSQDQMGNHAWQTKLGAYPWLSKISKNDIFSDVLIRSNSCILFEKVRNHILCTTPKSGVNCLLEMFLR